MNAKFILSSVILLLAGISSGEPGNLLSLLANEWGNGTVLEFRKKVYRDIPHAEKNGGSEAIVKWYEELIEYPDLLEETGMTYWMREKAELMLLYSLSRPVSTSTNCWLASAELLDRYRQITRQAESNANQKVDVSLVKTDPKKFNEVFYGKKPLEIRALNLRGIEKTLARVVTNEFPKSILPLLSETDGRKLMSDVLKRAGLDEVDSCAKGRSTHRSWNGAILTGAVSSLVLVGCFMIGRKCRRVETREEI